METWSSMDRLWYLVLSLEDRDWTRRVKEGSKLDGGSFA